MSFRIDDEKLFEKYKAIWTKIEDFKNIPVYDDRYIKTKLRTYGNKVYTNFRCLKVLEDDTECKYSYSIDSIPVYKNKYYLQIYLDNCSYKITSKQITDYLDDNLFEVKIL